MTQSGTHDNDPWNFVEAAMRGFTGVTKIAVYYFFIRCEGVPDIDSVFSPFLDDSLKGSTIDINDDSSISTGSRPSTAKKRKRIEDAVDSLVDQSTQLLDVLKQSTEASAKLAEAAMLRDNFNQRIEIAKALGDTEALKTLMEEATMNRPT